MLLIAGCGLVPGRVAPGVVIDGWRIDRPVDCPAISECDEFIPAAVAGLDQRDPGHLAITDVALYTQADETGRPIVGVCSGGCSVVAVFQLLDGSLRAIGVGTPGIATEPMTFDYGPVPTP